MRPSRRKLAGWPQGRDFVVAIICVTAALATPQASSAETAAAATPSCRYAERLASLGERAQAAEAYRAVLQATPGSECAYRGLEDSTRETFPERFDHDLSAVGKWLARVVLALIALGIAGLLVVFALRRTRVLPPQPRLNVGEFGDAPTAELNGAAMSAMLRTAIVSENTTRSGSIQVVASTTYASESFNALGEVSSQIKTALAILTLADQLIGRPRFNVAGQVLPAGPRGAGVSISVERNNSYAANGELWADDFGYRTDPHPYFRLVVPCSAWIQHQVAVASKASDLPTRSAKSAALLAAGNESQRRGEVPLARQNYRAALAEDETNTGALNNLALLSAREGDYATCLACLERARAVLERGEA